jgi:hypothetical protein
MSNTASISTSIFDELIVTIESIGVEKTKRTLQEARTRGLILSNTSIDNIINVIVEITGVDKERILSGTDKGDERKMAVALSIYYIKVEFKYSYSDLKKIFNKDEGALCRYNKFVEKLPTKPKTDFDKKLTEYCKKVELLLTREKIK